MSRSTSRHRKKPKKRVRDQYWDDDRPGFNYDYVEVPLPTREYNKDQALSEQADSYSDNAIFQNLDEFIYDYANRYIQKKNRPYSDLLRDKKRAAKLQYKLDKAASIYFTKIQFKVYISRYKLSRKLKDIASDLGCTQSYISHVLRGINKKFIALLRLDKKKHKYKKHFNPPKQTPS